jgi:hypothetical protein
MADYFLVLDGTSFERDIRPALATSWRQRSFEPCRALCAALVPAAVAFSRRYHTGTDEPFVARVASGLPFDRAFWRTLAGEVLLVAAADIPELQTCPDTLCRLLECNAEQDLPRGQLPPILQAHRGSRDLTFGLAVYRPDHAGYNNAADVGRLTEYLAAVRPETWTPQNLEGDDAEDRAEELAFARQCLAALCDVYRQAQARGRVIVLESIW